MSELETPVLTPETPAAPWFEKYGVSADDAGILGKYKDATEAIKSIPARERYVSQTVQLPSATAKPTERVKQAREIMGRLGAFESADKYKEMILATLPEDMKDKVPEEKINAMAESAYEDGLLPHVFEKSLKTNIALAQERLQAEADEETAKLRAQKDDDEHLGQVFGRDKTTKLKDAETFARHYDDTLLRQDNGPGGRAGLTPEQLAEGGGVLFRVLKQVNSPYLYRVFADLQQRVFGEGGMRDHNQPPSVRQREEQILDSVKEDYAVLGEDRIQQYARERAGGPR